MQYLRLHYCAFGPSQSLVSHLTQAILIVLLCSVLANVAEQFFCPALASVARWLRLPEDVAGATLLSFGNGAPDVFTQIACSAQCERAGNIARYWGGARSQLLRGVCSIPHRRARGTRGE